MGPMEAVAVAEQNVFNLFAGEGIDRVGLEENESECCCWMITIGFSRPWVRNVGSVPSGASGRTLRIFRSAKRWGRTINQ